MASPGNSTQRARSLLMAVTAQSSCAALALCAALVACGKPDSHQPAATTQTDRLCAAIKDGGYTKKCLANPRDHTVGIVADTSDDQAARELCARVAGSSKRLAAGLSDQWKLQVYSPYRDDKPLAECPLD